MTSLPSKMCVPCQAGTPPLNASIIATLMSQLDPQWTQPDPAKIQREFRFKDFKTTLAFVNQVGELAEAEGHHPDIFLTWGKAVITLWTHKIGGLSESDFILASKIDLVLPRASA